MHMIERDDYDNEHLTVSKRFNEPFRIISRRCVRVWYNQNRLDKVLTNLIFAFPFCDLIYAFDANGLQVSSNIRKSKINRGAYGQDLSMRPIAMSLSVLNNAEQTGVFLCDAYVSQITRRPCVTLMYRVSSGPDLLGFIAADFDPEELSCNPDM